MFYAHFVLSKKGPLARIWLAAHWDKKLTRAHVFETNISSSVEAILEPKVKLALRTSGHLLLGVVRIYSRQAKYLLADCNEAFVKIKMAFRPGAEVQEEAHRDSCSLAAITLADNMHDFESTLAELTEMDPYSISVNQSRPEDITMREEFGEPNLGRPDDDFGDSTFEEGGEREYGGDHSAGDVMEMDEHQEADLTLTNELVRSQPSQVYAEMPPSVSMASNDEFGDMMDVDYDSGENLDRNMEEAVMFQDTTTEKIVDSFSRIDSELADTTMDTTVEPVEAVEAVPDVTLSLACVPEEDHMIMTDNICPRDEDIAHTFPASPSVHVPSPIPHTPVMPRATVPTTIDIAPGITTSPPIIPTITTTTAASTATATVKRLPQFVLPPVTQASRIDHRRTPKRKRRLLIDEHKSIPSDVMKMQMQDTSEITTRLDLAPPTRKLMLWKETGSVDSLFSTPGRAIPSRVLQRLFYRNLKTVPVPNDSPDGLPVFRTMRVNPTHDGSGLVIVRDSVERVERVEEREAQVERIEHEEVQIEREDVRVTVPEHHEEAQVVSHDLYNLVEVEEPRNNSHEPQMHPGACSSYSANYDCFSGQPTPRRDPEEEEHDQEEEEERRRLQEQAQLQEELERRLRQQLEAEEAPVACANDVAPVDLTESLVGRFSDVSDIEKQRMSVAATSEPLEASYGPDSVFEVTFVDQSIISGIDDDSVLKNTTTTSSTAASDVPALSGSNKLQNTMLALDNELDIIDRQFPIEMTQEGLEKRSEIMLAVLQDAMRRDNQVVFQHLTVSNNKKQAASKFYTLLLLGKQKAISLHQETPFSNIIITPYVCT